MASNNTTPIRDGKQFEKIKLVFFIDKIKNLNSCHGYKKDRTKDFASIKNRINLYKDPSKR
jgi:hypothetical protein